MLPGERFVVPGLAFHREAIMATYALGQYAIVRGVIEGTRGPGDG